MAKEKEKRLEKRLIGKKNLNWLPDISSSSYG